MDYVEMAKPFLEWISPVEFSVFLPFCKGNGIDVCCGDHIWPGTFGIDVVPAGEPYSPSAPHKKSIAHLSYDCMDLPFKDEVLDFVICVHGMEHLPDVREALLEFSRVLKIGGYLCLLTPDISYVTVEDAKPHGLNPSEFQAILEELGHLEIVFFDTIKNNWTFDCVALKTKSQKCYLEPEKKETATTDEDKEVIVRFEPEMEQRLEVLTIYKKYGGSCEKPKSRNRKGSRAYC